MVLQDAIMEFFKEHAVKGKTDTEIVKADGREWASPIRRGQGDNLSAPSPSPRAI